MLDLSWNTLILKQIGYNKWITEKDVFSVSDADEDVFSDSDASTPNRSRTYDLLVTSPDALPLSYKVTNATKLGSCDKHPAYC